MNSIQISVIIPVYNVENFISHAVNSALDQPEVKEVILIDDGSKDNSLQLCIELSTKDARIRVIHHPDNANLGASASRNLGIKTSSYPYIAFLDADDYYLSNRFATTSQIFCNNKEVHGVYEAVGIHYQDENAKMLYQKVGMRELTTIRRIVHPKHLFYNLMKGGIGHFHLNGFTAKKEVFYNVSFFDEKFHFGEDTLITFQLSAKCCLVAGNILTPVAVRRVHSNNRITSHVAEKRMAYHEMIRMWGVFLTWGKYNLNKHQYKNALTRYTSQLSHIDMIDDFHWSDYFISRKKILILLFNSPSLFFNTRFVISLFPKKVIKIIRNNY